MSEANAERGEVMVELDGVDHVLRPSFEAQVAIERQCGRSIELLAQAAGEGSMSIEEAAIVVTECVKAYGKATGEASLTGYTATRVGECIIETGKLGIVKRLELLLYLAANGGYRASGEVRTLPTMADLTGSADTDA